MFPSWTNVTIEPPMSSRLIGETSSKNKGGRWQMRKICHRPIFYYAGWFFFICRLLLYRLWLLLNPANSSAMAPSATSLLIPSPGLSFQRLLKWAFLRISSCRVIYASCSSACYSMTTLLLSRKAAFSLVADNESCFTTSSCFYQDTVLLAELL